MARRRGRYCKRVQDVEVLLYVNTIKVLRSLTNTLTLYVSCPASKSTVCQCVYSKLLAEGIAGARGGISKFIAGVQPHLANKARSKHPVEKLKLARLGGYN